MKQGGVILRWAKDPDAARAVRSVLTGADGRSVLKRYGLFLPEGVSLGLDRHSRQAYAYRSGPWSSISCSAFPWRMGWPFHAGD